MDKKISDGKELLNKDLILREKLALQRTILANQSTLLAFLRTSMYFMVAGLSVRQFINLKNGLFVEIMLMLFAFVIFLTGFLNYFIQRRKIRESEKHIGDYKLEYLNT
jgi:putative membrane protein